jgi:hypothetical protein
VRHRGGFTQRTAFIPVAGSRLRFTRHGSGTYIADRVPASPIRTSPDGEGPPDRRLNVFYVGTFSKCMLSALRLGFIIAPDWAMRTLVAAKNCLALLHADSGRGRGIHLRGSLGASCPDCGPRSRGAGDSMASGNLQDVVESDVRSYRIPRRRISPIEAMRRDIGNGTQMRLQL